MSSTISEVTPPNALSVIYTFSQGQGNRSIQSVVDADSQWPQLDRPD